MIHAKQKYKSQKTFFNLKNIAHLTSSFIRFRSFYSAIKMYQYLNDFVALLTYFLDLVSVRISVEQRKNCTLFNKCHRLKVKLRWYCILDYYDHFWMDYKMLWAGLTLHIYINMHQLNISLTLHGVSTLFLYGNLSKLTLFLGADKFGEQSLLPELFAADANVTRRKWKPEIARTENSYENGVCDSLGV